MRSDPKIRPPKLALRFLRWFCRPRLLEDVEGDVMELFHLRSESHPTRARWLFLIDVLLLFRPGIIKPFRITSGLKNLVMLRNYLSVAFRFALRHKGHTTLNLLGLAVGMAVAILILLWVDDEVKMDRFHADSDRIYQVWRNMYQSSGEVMTTPAIPQPLELVLESDYPEVEQVTLLSWPIESAVQYQDQIYYESGRYASPEFFDIFSYPLLLGDQTTAMEDLSSVVISESLAAKYFGNNWREEALGQALRMDNRKDFTVTAVFQDPGEHSSLQFDWMVPAREYIQRNSWVENWSNGGFGMIIKLREGADIAATREKVRQEVNENTDYVADERIYLQPMADAYLYSKFENGLPVGGRIQYVRIFLIVAIFILIIACINFTNLATARSNLRAREIGIRKVMGAQKSGLRWQFFSESYLLSFFSIILGIILVFATTPYFNYLTGKHLFLDPTSPRILLGLVLVLTFTGFVSGIYPAMLMPSFKTIQSLKGLLKHGTGEKLFRKGLVTFQFALSILMIIGTVIVYQQLRYILNMDLGLDKENLVYVQMERELIGKREVYRSELEQSPGIASVTFTSGNPLSYGRSTGSADWDGKDPDDNIEINVMNIDHTFLNTMDIDLLKGRNFSIDLKTDTANYLINEVAAGIMGFENPIDQNLTVWGQKGKIVGLIKNFHMDSMFEPIEPLIIRYDPNNTYFALIRTQGNIKDAMEDIEAVTLAQSPSFPFRYDFLDAAYEENYRNEMTLSQLAKIFAFISIFISCLGLLGLASFSASQRSKEIGIRKVHGARVYQLVMLLTKDYAQLIFIAFLLAVPAAYLLMRSWLNNFVFQIDMSVLVFLFSGMLVFLVGILIVGLKSYQAAVVDPVRTLREDN